MYKIINKITNETISTGLPSTSLDEAIRLSGGDIINSIDENVIIGGKYYYYDDLELVIDE